MPQVLEYGKHKNQQKAHREQQDLELVPFAVGLPVPLDANRELDDHDSAFDEDENELDVFEDTSGLFSFRVLGH